MLNGIDFTGHPALENVSNVFIFAVIVVLAVFTLLSFIRAVVGPRMADRVVAVNMIGTMIIVVIAIFSVTMEGYLADICLIYAMISFLAVVVLTKLYTGVFNKKSNGHGTDDEMTVNLNPEDELDTGIDNLGARSTK